MLTARVRPGSPTYEGAPVSGAVSTLTRDRARPCAGLVTDLVTRCGQGDEAALAALFDLFHPVASSLAITDVPERDVTDVVLAAFSRIWRRAGEFDPGVQSAISWVLGELSASVENDASSSPRTSTRPSRLALSAPGGTHLEAPVAG